MERHIAKRLGLPCAVISAPVHVQDYPARYSPQMGFEGANVIFDTWVHPLMMGLEEHLLTMFRDDFEFAEGKAPSHLGGAAHAAPPAAPAIVVPAAPVMPVMPVTAAAIETLPAPPPEAVVVAGWTDDAEKELKKIPFFVRGKAKRNTERYAQEHQLARITLETLYEAKAYAKAHY